MLLGLQDLGGKLTTESHIGVILGPSLAFLWVMLKLSRAMVGHAEAICQVLFGHVVGLCPKVPSPRMGFDKLCCIHFGVKCKDRSNILGPDWGQVWPALLRYLEATALLLAAKLGDLEGKLGYREVMLKLSRCSSYMSDFVRPCCWFCIQKCFPSSRTKI